MENATPLISLAPALKKQKSILLTIYLSISNDILWINNLKMAHTGKECVPVIY